MAKLQRVPSDFPTNFSLLSLLLFLKNSCKKTAFDFTQHLQSSNKSWSSVVNRGNIVEGIVNSADRASFFWTQTALEGRAEQLIREKQDWTKTFSAGPHLADVCPALQRRGDWSANMSQPSKPFDICWVGTTLFVCVCGLVCVCGQNNQICKSGKKVLSVICLSERLKWKPSGVLIALSITFNEVVILM